MPAIFSFKCSYCGEVHEGSPSFGYRAPDPYLHQSDEIQESGHLDSDLCRYTDEDGEHYFIRVVVEIPIHGVSEPFMWGVWVSLSQESFDHYVETYNEPVEGHGYFGWFSNSLPYYDDTYALATDVYPRLGGDRPNLAIHEAKHEFYNDYASGISVEKAQEIAELCMHS